MMARAPRGDEQIENEPAVDSLSDRAIAAIKRLIVTHQLGSTVPISEGGLAEELQMSKAPVREALALLRRQGWVRVLPRSGYVAAPVTLEEARNLVLVRTALEPEAAALAARYAARWPEECGALNAYAGQQHGDGIEAELIAHHRFHRRVAVLSGNAELERALTEVLHKLQRYYTLDFLPVAGQEYALDHTDLGERICAGDEDGAREAARAHATSAGNELIDRLLDSESVSRADLASGQPLGGQVRAS
jgi:DNA-binding GntR family transcriptional regulator